MKEVIKQIRWLPFKSTKTKDGVWVVFGKTLTFLAIMVAAFLLIDMLLSVTHNFGGLL